MKHCIFLTLLISAGCAQMPSLFQSVEDIATDTAIKIEVDKEAISRDHEIYIQLNIQSALEEDTKK